MRLARETIGFLVSIPGWMMIGVVRFYQLAISPLLPGTCRFEPTCSTYSIQAIRKYGALMGGWKTLCRLVRCQPLCKGGYDPP